MSPPALLAALAAAFAPARAASSLARAPDPATATDAARLAGLPRPDRLDALARALAAGPPRSPRARALAAAAERPRLAEMLRRADQGAPPAGLLARLIAERLQAEP